MIRTPPEANSEYSRGIPASPGVSAPRSSVLLAVLVAGWLSAVILIVAEFTPLYRVRLTSGGVLIKSVSTGSHQSYALIPIALLAAFLAFGVWRTGSRPALLAIGTLGILALLISLVGDLPDAHASGLVGSQATHYQTATSRPSAGFYMETLGAVLLLITCVCGFLLLGAPAVRAGRRPDGAAGAA
jgi:hypothetical protein